jgi:hypothetical protein
MDGRAVSPSTICSQPPRRSAGAAGGAAGSRPAALPPTQVFTSALAALLFSVYVVYAVQLLAVGQHMFAL